MPALLFQSTAAGRVEHLRIDTGRENLNVRSRAQEETVATVRFVETYGMHATIGRALGPRGAQD